MSVEHMNGVTLDVEPARLLLDSLAGSMTYESGGSGESAGRPISVLVMDDEAMFRRIVCGYLTRQGMLVKSVADGMSGLELAAVERFDVVVQDLIMPGPQAEEIITRLWALHPGLPIIVISGIMDNQLGQSLLDMGVYAVMSKPLRFERIAYLCRSAAAGVTAD